MDSIPKTTACDAKNITSDDSFIHKVNFSTAEWSMDSCESATQMNDTMDIFNYRIVEKYTVNKISADAITSTNYKVVDTSGLGWNEYFFDDSLNQSKSIKLEDTLVFVTIVKLQLIAVQQKQC